MNENYGADESGATKYYCDRVLDVHVERVDASYHSNLNLRELSNFGNFG